MTASYPETLVPFLDGGFVVTSVRLEKLQVLFGQLLFAAETTHGRRVQLSDVLHLLQFRWASAPVPRSGRRDLPAAGSTCWWNKSTHALNQLFRFIQSPPPPPPPFDFHRKFSSTRPFSFFKKNFKLNNKMKKFFFFKLKFNNKIKQFFFKKRRKCWRVWLHLPSLGSGQRRAEPAGP